MILPIVAYGDPVLRKLCTDIDPNYPNLSALIANMFETMYNANGVGLAAPQIGKAIRLFLVDSAQVLNTEDAEGPEKGTGIKQAFINAEIIETSGTPWAYEEGCLSIPDIRENVTRDETIVIRYLNEKFEQKEETFTGINARVILHEYDHIEGVLFTDYLSNLKKRMLKRRLAKISKGEIRAEYRMRFPAFKKSKRR